MGAGVILPSWGVSQKKGRREDPGHVVIHKERRLRGYLRSGFQKDGCFNSLPE